MKSNQTIKYDSIMVDENGVKTKGRIHVSNVSLSFERKIGLISKKFEPMLKIPIESITSFNKKTYLCKKKRKVYKTYKNGNKKGHKIHVDSIKKHEI